MRRQTVFAFSFAVLLGFTIGACNCGKKPPVEPPPDEEDAGEEDAGYLPYDGGPLTANTTDGGPQSTCLAQGVSCSTAQGGVCCSGVCGTGGVCTSPIFCKGPGEACVTSTQCCTNHCLGGTCSAQQCSDVAQGCAVNGDCCTGNCVGGTCAAIPGATSTCKVIGQACASGADCCSTNCQGGVCVRAYSCQANNDVCLANSDCCGNVCSGSGGTAGYCVQITGGGGGGCIQDGNPCAGSSNCCTRICLDLGSGASVCQVAGGCRLTGDYCPSQIACCGGEAVGGVGGDVQCTNTRCDNGQSCNPVGNICGEWQPLPDGGQFKINASENCCDGKKAVCKLDQSGIPRCFGGGSNQCPTGYTGDPGCCIAAGQNCAFRDQCCNNNLCLPGPGDAGFVCTPPTSCDPVGASCTPGASNCCTGTYCLAAGEFGYACQTTGGGGDGGAGGGGGDGGVPNPGDAGTGTCLSNQSNCTTAAECCSKVCIAGKCQPPAACQPQGSICTSAADCCTGLTCQINPGNVSGTCQQSGGSCGGLGQSCSPASPCCLGLDCVTSSIGLCDGTTPCTCATIPG